MVTGRAAQGPFGLALLVAAVPAPVYLGRELLDGTIQAALDYVAAHAAALTPTMVSLLDVKLIGDRIFLFVLLADREAERTIEALLAERYASNVLEARVASRG
jgi:hypothetical protein